MIYEAKPHVPASSQEELMRQLKTFLAGAGGTTRHSVKPALCTTALHLLTHLPAAREAVLEYFGHILDGIVARCSPSRDNQDSRQNYDEDEEYVLEQLSQTLTDLVSSSPASVSSAWSAIVSTWSLDTLGKLSSKWSNKICGKDASLNGQLSSWLSVNVGRVLLDLCSDSLSRIMVSNTGPDTDQCVATLLETSVKHTPHFDWVMAHIGSCFPGTMTSRVLSTGLKDFIAGSEQGVSGDIVLSRHPRLTCAVNILTHLTSTHIADVEAAVHQLLVTSLTGVRSAANIATVPFLLSLASISSGVRRAVTSHLAPVLSPHVDKIPDLVTQWNEKYFSTGSNSLVTAVCQLLLSSDRGGPQLLLLLLQAGSREDGVGSAARMLINTVLSDLFGQVHNVSRTKVDDISVFNGMSQVMPQIQHKLLSPNPNIVASCSSLVYLYCLYKGRSVSGGVIKYLLCHESSDGSLTTLLQLVDQLEQFHTNIVKDAVTMGLRDTTGDKLCLLTNLTTLCEQGRSSWIEAVESCQEQLGQLLQRQELISSILKLLVLVPPSKKLRVRTIYKLSQAVVTVITDTVTRETSAEERMARVATCEAILTQLCSLKCGLQITLRFLLDACLNTEFCCQLGGKMTTETVKHKTSVSLLQENYNQGTKPVQPLGATVTYHAGVIGAGARGSDDSTVNSKEDQDVNRSLVAGVITRVCESRGSEGYKQLALMIVEMVSPDIMYNGLPWPEEDFIKVTIERDLTISRMLSRHPILWTLLSVLARSRPALCYCSVIIRAVLAVLISHWSGHVTSSLAEHPGQLETTVKVLDLMAIGQYVPPQLGLLPQIITILDPFQLHCILIGKNYSADTSDKQLSFSSRHMELHEDERARSQSVCGEC